MNLPAGQAEQDGHCAEADCGLTLHGHGSGRVVQKIRFDLLRDEHSEAELQNEKQHDQRAENAQGNLDAPMRFRACHETSLCTTYMPVPSIIPPNIL